MTWRLLRGGDPSSSSRGRMFYFTCLCYWLLIPPAFKFALDVKVKDLLKPECLPGCHGVCASGLSTPSDCRVCSFPRSLVWWRRMFSVHFSSLWWTFKKVKSKNHRKPIVCSHWHMVMKVSYCLRIMLQEVFQPAVFRNDALAPLWITICFC